MARIRRGDVVLASVPRGTSFKIRPVVVVQNDQNNARLTNTIVAMVTNNVRLATREPTQILIDLSTAEGRQSGLAHTSAVKCENLYTLPSRVLRKIGSIPDTLMQKADAALKVSLALP